MGDGGRLLRYGVVTGVVGLYVGIGFLFHPGADAYLLIGIPITVLFQALIARRPLRELWLARGQPFRFDRWTIPWLLLFLIGPVLVVAEGVRAQSWSAVAYGLAAMVGAGGAALAFRVLGTSNRRQLGLLLALMVLISLVRLLLLRRGLRGPGVGMRLRTEVQSLLFYVPAVFVAEEVFFRGALDSYLHRDEPGAGWISAAFISVLWGLWHTPVVGPLSVSVVLDLIVVQLMLGLILSWLWRRTGNLAMPGTVHAMLDALRNGLLL